MSRIEKGTYRESDFKNIDDKLYALGMIIATYEGDEVTIENFILKCLGDEYLSIYNTMKSLRKAVLEIREEEMKLG